MGAAAGSSGDPATGGRYPTAARGEASPCQGRAPRGHHMMTCDDRQPLITWDLDRNEEIVVNLAHAPARENTTVPAHTKTQRLIDDITRKVESGEWPPGHQLPHDQELRAEYDVSQMTIRTAMERLRHLVESVPGKGRFVRSSM